VIVDESHILSTGRGHAVESGIMRFTKINSGARILFLSATMPNVDQLGAWLKTLNAKETKVIYSTWRPVSLQFHYREYPIVRNRFGGESYQASQEAKKAIAIGIVKSKPTEKFLVFTHDKNTGRGMVKRLQDEGIESQFHNADLDLTERLDVEALFTKREGGLRVLISTSTLAWGRNLPARNVVIVGVHRGLNEVDELDIIQMAGRAGRYGIDDEGHVYLILPEMTTESWKETFRNPRPVMSNLRSHQVLAFHVLAEIQNRVITDARTLLGWYSRSLAYFQGEEFGIADAKGLLDDLEKMEMVINKGTHYLLTGLGKVSGWLYFSPYDVYAWYRNFEQLFRGKDGIIPLIDDTSISWALTDIPSNDWGYIPKDIQAEADEMKWKLRNRGIQASDAVHFSLAAMKCLNGIELEGVLKANARAIKYDIQRITQALGLIDSMYGKWDKKEFWKVLQPRINYGIPEEMIELVRLPGIGGVKAKKMWSAGIHSLSDVVSNTEGMKGIFVPVMIKKLQSEAKKLLLKASQGELKVNEG
jgi:replicative superfamily II helicase